jgi:hypothetical protein
MTVSAVTSSTNILQSDSTSSSSSGIYDKMDTNKDGVVSEAERMAYMMKHPTEAADDQQNQKPPVIENGEVGNNLDTTA